MRIRITVILMIAIGGLVALAVSAVLFVSASASIKNTLELTRDRAELTISSIERGVEDHLAPARNLVAEISGRIAQSTLDINDREQLVATLSGALAPAPQIGGIVIWRPDGSGLWVVRHPGGIEVSDGGGPDNPASKAYLADVNAEKGIHWGAPFFLEGATYITITGVVDRGGVYGGTIAVGVSLVELSRSMSELAEGGATAFVLYGDDKVLAHPAMLDAAYSARLSADAPLLSIDQVGDPVLAEFNSLPVADLPSKKEFDLRRPVRRGIGDIIISRKLDTFGPVPWQIGVHVPVESVNQQMQRLVGSIGLSFALFIVAVAAAIILARRIARPIRAVSTAAQHVARLELDDIEPLKRSHIRELDEQARTFNSMIQGLRWFRTYVPQTLVRRLMQTAGAADVRSDELTVMFTDIVGFTSLSESMPPAEVAEMLNRHFAILNACIEAEDGTLDKYIGDATMAFWGAPEPAPDHAARACRAALAIAKAVEEKVAAGDKPAIRIKIALHTGPLIVGNIGAPSRMNYTVVGDTVNVCSRIESSSGEFDDGRPAIVIASGDVVAATGDAFLFEPVGERMVKGRARAVELWRLTGAKDSL